MSLTQYFFQKLHDEMKIIDILKSKPKNKIRLDPIDPQDLNVDFEIVQKWSRNNLQLLHLIMENGMATFLCNYQYIYQHYEELIFVERNIQCIDSTFMNFKNLISLNLSQNHINTLENLPPSLQQLYIDFNQIQQIKKVKLNSASTHQNLALLSISHNKLTDLHLQKIVKYYPNLRCLNVSYNGVVDIRSFVSKVKQLKKIKVLSAIGNPISLLKIYYDYISQNIQLKIIDNQKYIKPQELPKKPVEKKPQPKEQVKQEKKDPKKDNKKSSKQPQPVVQEPPKIQIVQPVKKQLTQQNFTKCSFNISISNFQNFTGNLYDSSIFGPQNVPIDKIQSCYWVQYQFMGTKQQLYEKKVRYDQAAIIENQPSRLTFDLNINSLFQINQNNRNKFEEGILIKICSEQPKVQTNLQTGEQKVIKENNQIVLKRQIVGEVFVDLRQFYFNKNKKIEKLFRLWEPEICSRPYFKDHSPNQQTQINKRKDQFQQKLKKEEESKMKLLEQEENAKGQKKGGKDTKKAEKKPPQKKQGKQTVSQKKTIQKCGFPMDSKIYCYLNENKIYKARGESLAVKIEIL